MPRVADPRAKIVLLRAAEQVFAERGLAAAKVEEIAKRAGLSKGAFYLHFETKEAALEHIVESFLARCGSYFARPKDFADVPDDLPGVLAFWNERDQEIYEFLWENRAMLRILPTCHGAYEHLFETFRTEIDQRTREWVELFQKKGAFRADIEPALCATLIGGAYNQLTFELARAQVRPPLETWVRFAQDTFARAYGTPKLIDALEKRNRRVSLQGKRTERRAARGKE